MTNKQNNRAVVLLSGGLDSATALWLALRDIGSEGKVFALTISYGQRHEVEIKCAKALAEKSRCAHHYQINVDLGAWGGSALTTPAIPVPKDRDETEMSSHIPVTYVPARNSVFLAIAGSLAEAVGARHIYCGVNAVDYSGYPDCRPEFVGAMQDALNLGTQEGARMRFGNGDPWLTIHAPLVKMAKADIIRTGLELGVPYALTHSCYDPVMVQSISRYECSNPWVACGRCDSCKIRLAAWNQVGTEDPIPYFARQV